MEDLRSVAENLRRSKSAILLVWEDRIRRKLKSARNEDHIALKNSVPEFLDDLAMGMEVGLIKVCKNIIHFAHKHGSERARNTSYSIEDALNEYKILREEIFTHLEMEAPISPKARDMILEAIYVGMAKAAAEYSRIQKVRTEETNNLLETVLNQMPAGVSITSVPTGEVLRRNQKASELFPVPYELYRENGAPLSSRDYPTNRTIKYGELVREQVMIKRPDGSICHLRIRSAPILDPSGNMFAVVTIADDITHIKEKKHRLKEAFRNLKQITDTQPTLIAQVDRNFRYIFVNKAYNDWFGLPSSKILGKTLRDLIGDEVWKTALPYYQQALNGNRVTFEATVPYRTALRNVVATYAPGRNEKGEIETIYISILDVTAQKKAIEDLRTTENRYASLFHNMNEEVHVWKLVFNENHEIINWTLVDANAPALSSWSKSLQEIKGQTPDEIFGEGATKRFLSTIRKVADEGQSQTLEAYFPNLHRHYRLMSFIVDDMLYTVGTDITEIKRVENILRESEARHRQLVNSIPQLAWTTDPNGMGTYVNARFTEFTGETIEQVKDDLAAHLIHPDDQHLVRHAWKLAWSEGKEMECEHRLRSKSGEYHWFLTRAVPVLDDEGKIIKWFGTNTDISEQKATLDALHEETILRDKFVSTLSHDLRTPLTAARMSAELIRRKSADDRALSFSSRIIENLDRANKMIEDLLDASKVRAGKELVPDLREVDVVDITRRTLEDLSTIHGDRFVMSSPQELMAWIDPSGFRRVLENLCTNAIKYGSPNDQVTIRLTQSHEDLFLSVHNHGHPLFNVDKQRLFEPFHRGEGTGEKKGWGIGLTIVRGVTQAHRGEVSIDTSPKGTTFTIRLPLDARRARENQNHLH